MSDATDFEDSVIDLLGQSGHRVTPEMQLGGKKIDAYYEEIRKGKKIRTAVECKFYKGKLERSDVVKIKSDYESLLKQNLIDEIFIVTKEGLTPTAITYVNSFPFLSHQTFSELQFDLIDFRDYLSGLVNQYEKDEINKYFIEIHDLNGENIESKLIDWEKISEYTPLAILASYGMGKTTLARRLAFRFARNCLENTELRIPILIKLGDISGEENLEGLLGKFFTVVYSIRNYSFNNFINLNSKGRFIIFFDGFDEMKRTLTWDDFKYNLNQINRLVNGKSKVVILGRPTAFLNEEEQDFALHGRKRLAKMIYKDPEWPDYKEVHISSLSGPQVSQFLHKYWEYKLDSGNFSVSERTNYQKLLNGDEIEKIATKKHSDIARRPVQLKMLADVLPQWNGSYDNLTISILYSQFIDQVIQREMLSKPTRDRFDTLKRRDFASQIAWWMWTEERKTSISAGNIPIVILKKFTSKDEEIEGVRRDLVAACFLERKSSDVLFFPHRSFQEYLVAESIIKKVIDGEIDISFADRIATDEIFDFIINIIGFEDLGKLGKIISDFRGKISVRWLKSFYADEWGRSYVSRQLGLNHQDMTNLDNRNNGVSRRFSRLKFENDIQKDVNNPWFLASLTIYSYLNTGDLHIKKNLLNHIEKLIVKNIENSENPESDKQVIFCFLCACILLNSDEKGLSKYLNYICDFVLKNIVVKHNSVVHVREIAINSQTIISEIFFDRKESKAILEKCYPSIVLILSDYCLPSEWISEDGTRIISSVITLAKKVVVSDKDIEKIEKCMKN